MTEPAADPRVLARALLLSPAEMAAADAFAIAAGVPGATLMANAGRAVAEAIAARCSPRPVAVLCGPGNNGGDGFVAARVLADAGWPVRVASLVPVSAYRGDAAMFATDWGEATELSEASLDGARLVVDALFGAGLNRVLDGTAAAALRAAEARGLPIVAVDVPSGLDGATGAVRGYAPRAALTVSFFRAKPGHLLLPGRDLCGECAIVDIGIPEAAAPASRARCWRNGPELWRLPRLGADAHKYRRGHLLAAGGPMTGAIRLAVRGARRAGVGLASVVCDAADAPAYSHDPGVIVLAGGDDAFAAALADGRRNVALIGPGHGETERLRGRVAAILAAGRACVLDADVFGAFAEAPSALFDAIRAPTVLTPHAGEFARLFPDLDAARDRLGAARAAAARSRAVMVLKGADTVIAAPDGRAAINADAPPTLATGGSGDVLAGFAAGLLGQGMAAFEAACAAVWLHGRAAAAFGPGLIAEDLPEMLPGVLRALDGG